MNILWNPVFNLLRYFIQNSKSPPFVAFQLARISLKDTSKNPCLSFEPVPHKAVAIFFFRRSTGLLPTPKASLWERDSPRESFGPLGRIPVEQFCLFYLLIMPKVQRTPLEHPFPEGIPSPKGCLWHGAGLTTDYAKGPKDSFGGASLRG